VGLVAAHTEPELKMELKHVPSNEPIEELGLLDKELTYLVELPKPLGLTIGADHNRFFFFCFLFSLLLHQIVLNLG